MTTHDAMNKLDEMREYFTTCYQNAAKGSEAELRFMDYVIALDMAWMAMNEAEDDGK